MKKQQTDVLSLYYYRESFGPTVIEHATAFERLSEFDVTAINTADPDATERMRRVEPKAVLLHYTLFGMQWYQLTEEQQYIVAHYNAIKAAFYQDEYYHVPKRFRFIDEAGIDCVYTMVEPQYFNETYYKYCSAPVIRNSLTGYVSDELLAISKTVAAENHPRDLDIGYRGHELDICYGLGGQEKYHIAHDFKRHTKDMGLTLDVETAVDKRIYGDGWYRFIARCKGMLGVEAGVSAFDFDDVIRVQAHKLRKQTPPVSDDVIYETVVKPYENNLYYRTISPRHFEAAALGTCQILFEGKYSGLMDPDVHYIPLKKDFSNIGDVMDKFRDENHRRQIADTARRDLIESGRYTYHEFVNEVERDLKLLGLKAGHRSNP